MTPPLPPSPPASKEPSRQTLQQAATWFVLLASGEADDEDRQRWHVWRMAHPSHEQAWQRLEERTAGFARIPPAQAPASVQALCRAEPAKTPRRRKTLVHLLAVLVVALSGWQGYLHSDWSADLLTDVGHQQQAVLADGSRVQLDGNSAVEVVFTDKQRLLRLRRGRIMVTTAADPAPQQRPFLVESSDGRVLALGTQFTVEQEPSATRVSVLAARVALQSQQNTAGSPILIAGQSARFQRNGLSAQWATAAADTAWTQGMLIADDLPLAELLGQLSRYQKTPLQCAPSAAALRISGAFPINDSAGVLRALGDTLPIRLEQRKNLFGQSSLIVHAK